MLQCTSSNKTRVTSVPGSSGQVFNYNVKVINSSKKSVFYIKPLTQKQRFSKLSDLKACVQDETGQTKTDTVGYIEPGHGQKGKMRELRTDEDLGEMYVLHKRKRAVLLWCYDDVSEQSTVHRKRTQNTDNSAPSAKRQAIAKSISQVEDIIKKLKEKHGDGFSVEKLNCWAHMLNVGKHSSYDEPPDFPFFKQPKQKVKDTSSSASVQPTSSTVSATNSPTKRVGLRAQCIDQLSKWHALLNAGGIDQAQYDELKESILGDIKNFKSS